MSSDARNHGVHHPAVPPGQGDRDRRAAGTLWEWERYAGAPLEGAVRVLACPRFPHAARALAANMLASVERDRALGRICRDAGRYVGALATLHLYFSEALTLSALRDVCVASGFMSAGRARGVLGLLRELGWVATGPAVAGGGARRFVPTGEFLSAWSGQLRAALAAAAIIEPAATLVCERLGEPAAAATFIRLHAETILRGAPQVGDDIPLFRVLLHRDGGLLVAWFLLAAGRDGDPFPTATPVPISQTGIARRFGVSRVQVRRLLRDAVRAGLLTTKSHDGECREVTFGAGVAEYLRFLCAAQLAQLLAVAAATARAETPTDAEIKIVR